MKQIISFTAAVHRVCPVVTSCAVVNVVLLGDLEIAGWPLARPLSERRAGF